MLERILVAFVVVICGCTHQVVVNSYISKPHISYSLFNVVGGGRSSSMGVQVQQKLSRPFPAVQSCYRRRRRDSLFMSITAEKAAIALPQHEKLVQGKLDNGFTYIILPNRVPEGRFEAHLEVLSGSAFELEPQQGMAHLLEHVAYMGSPKRQLISGTGSRTNAYTDFHHTVFFAACPTQTPDQFWKRPMLPMALDALLDVMTTTVDEDRLEKERAAVLSEASMVNKMEYRVECQVLSELHNENRISQRFPIGKENLIKSWKREDVQRYHQTHYRPDNVILFVVGDVEVQTTIDSIKEKFGGLKPKLDAPKLLKESGEFPEISMRAVSRHFPPVVHRWSCPPSESDVLVPPSLMVTAPSVLTADQQAQKGMLPKPRIFKHELLQSFSFHLFAKRPIEPVTSKRSLRRELMRRMCLSALQIRFNVQQRQDPLFTFVDFNQLNWPREGCAVCSLDLTTDPASWRDAVRLAVREIRRLGLFGLTASELGRYKQAVLSEAEQAAAQADQTGNEEVLTELMEAEACGHTFMHPTQRLEATSEALESISLEDMKEVAKELCEHLSHIDTTEGVRPAAVIACAPMVDRNNQPFTVTDEEVAEAIASALTEELEPLLDTDVPDTLVTPEQLAAKAQITPPAWAPLEGKARDAAEEEAAAGRSSARALGVEQRRLTNGVRVNMVSMEDEPQRASVRLYVPGGRMRESKGKPGSVLIGSRTIQEGGAFLDVTREEVELFCIDHLVMVDILATEEALIFDFQTVTTTGPGGKVTGLEAVMQVLHIILTDFAYEDDALERAKQGFHEQFDSITRGLETACQEKLAESLSGGDPRYMTPNHAQIDALDMDTVRESIVSQLDPATIEVSMAGDVPMDFLEALALNYLGTVPRKTKSLADSGVQSMKVNTLGKGKQLGVYLPDSDERAMGYLAGPAPNKWGVMADGSLVTDALGTTGKDARRAHPLFGHVALLVMQEVANRRLFSVVREERRLTYDASFQLHGHESIQGGHYLVSVTSSPAQVGAAVQACKEALDSLRGTFGVMGDSVQSAKRTILNRFRVESMTNKFWVENLSGTQLEAVPLKTLRCISEFENALSSVTAQDVQQLVEVMGFTEDNMTTCVGITAPRPPSN